MLAVIDSDQVFLAVVLGDDDSGFLLSVEVEESNPIETYYIFRRVQVEGVYFDRLP